MYSKFLFKTNFAVSWCSAYAMHGNAAIDAIQYSLLLISKMAPALGTILVGAKDPFVVDLCLLYSAQFDLIKLELEPRTNLHKVDICLVLGVHVVAKGDEVVPIDKGDHTAAVRLWHGK